MGGAKRATITIERGYAPQATVVGVVRNVRLGGPERPVRPEAYLSVAQGRILGGALAVRTGNRLNHGQYDDHLPPGEGRLEWSAIAQSLRDAAFAGWIMLELRCPEGDLGTYFQHARAQALRLLDP